jgi:hypothetical protein
MLDRLRADNFAKTKLTKEHKEYTAATFIPVSGPKSADRPMYVDEWDTCEKYGCGARKMIEGHTHPFAPYGCQKGDCGSCGEKGYSPPLFEIYGIDSRKII